MAAPQEHRDDAKRDRILRAAREVCEARGVHRARMDEVAARAGVSKGTLYRFFESKEDLFLATMLASYEEGLRLVDSEVSRSRGPRERLEAYLDGMVGVLTTVGPRMHVQYQAWGVVAGEPAFQTRLYEFLRRFHRERDAELASLIREGQKAGAFLRDVDVAALTDGAGALLGGLLYRATFDPEQARAGVLRACFDAMVLAALLPARDERG